MLELGSEGPQCSLPPPRHCNCAAAADKGTQELRSVAEYKTKASHRLPPIINLFCFPQAPSSAALIIWLRLFLLLSPSLSLFLEKKKETSMAQRPYV